MEDTRLKVTFIKSETHWNCCTISTLEVHKLNSLTDEQACALANLAGFNGQETKVIHIGGYSVDKYNQMIVKVVTVLCDSGD